MSKHTQTTIQSPPLAEFLNTLPSPLITALVGLAPYITHTRHVLQVVTWSTSWQESTLALALWWAVCLLADTSLRNFLPISVLLLVSLARRRNNSKTPPSPPPVTEDALHQTVSDLTTIQSLLPSHLDVPPVTLELPALLRTTILLSVPYLLITHLVRLRVLVALAGTLALTWHARWAVLLRRALWRSAHFRWATYRTWGFLSGQIVTFPRPRLSLSLSSLRRTSASHVTSTVTSSDPEEDIQPAQAVRFLFSVYENQRWWMGLDWTAALLPGERPSWSSVPPALQPVSPPSSFSLPAPTTVYMPHPTRGKQGWRVRRTARWRWAEPEWRVYVHKEGENACRVERPLPKDEPPSSGSTSAARMLRAASRMRGEGSISIGSGASGGEKEKEREAEQERDREDKEDGEEEEEVCTDPDGWVYGDNKWEGPNAKGGMGKYTRFRRWTRIAILIETVDAIPPSPRSSSHSPSPSRSSTSQSSTPMTPYFSTDPEGLGIRRDEDNPDPHRVSVATPPVVVTVQPGHGRQQSGDIEHRSADAGEGGGDAESASGGSESGRESPSPMRGQDDGLRKRLQAAMAHV